MEIYLKLLVQRSYVKYLLSSSLIIFNQLIRQCKDKFEDWKETVVQFVISTTERKRSEDCPRMI